MDRQAHRAAIAQQLGTIEAEMKAIGFWTDDAPDLRDEVESGKITSYLDAPSFELWLQAIFLPNARKAVETDQFPATTQVGLMAMRQYDYHSFVPEAQNLLGLLYEFDRMVARYHEQGG
ncbi:MAG TPA: YqcC family protein [Rhodothermales bacterium]|nr:YqcC family protein [Rhodothermales bacterium]